MPDLLGLDVYLSQLADCPHVRKLALSTSRLHELFKAAFEDDAAAIHRLVKSGVPISPDPSHGNTALRSACQGRATRALHALLECGADPNERITYRSSVDGRVEEDFTPLMYAHYPEAIDLLVRYGADVNSVSKTGLSALMRMAHYGEAPAVEALLRHGADPALKQPKRQGREDRSALEFCQDALNFWTSIPRKELKPEAKAVIEGYRRTLTILVDANAS